MRIDVALAWAQQELTGTESPAVDARALLCHCLDKPRSYLYTWPDREISDQQYASFKELIALRKLGKPVAYLRGYQEFWSLKLNVSTATLIPRPETELLVEKVLELNELVSPTICDLGTGTGAIAIALAYELPQATVMGLDKVSEAVDLAKSNAQLHELENVSFEQSDWFTAVQKQRFDIIVSNPPYVETISDYLNQGDVRFEPTSALISGEDGLDDIRHILSRAPAHLTSNGVVLIEHGFNQGPAVAEIFSKYGFSKITTFKDINNFDRVTFGRWDTCE